jgi:formamidopyrimidine-DNA glycosylase
VPELPDLVVYAEALARRTVGERLERIRLGSPFVLRTVEPPPSAAAGRRVVAVDRLGKRLVVILEAGLFILVHLMRAGRLRWAATGTPLPRRIGLAALDFPTGSLLLIEAGSKRRAALHVVSGRAALTEFDAGGVEVAAVDQTAFTATLRRANHTIKRALTDPAIVSGIGNAYSDEILHRARLSPVALTRSLGDAEIGRLLEACRAVLTEWTERLRREAGDGFPEHVTAFRDGMAVHGRYRQPCPDCREPVQRIVFADRETNYCARCQTGGRLLADRALSRLLKSDWPRSLEELEERRARHEVGNPPGGGTVDRA